MKVHREGVAEAIKSVLIILAGVVSGIIGGGNVCDSFLVDANSLGAQKVRFRDAMTSELNW